MQAEEPQDEEPSLDSFPQVGFCADCYEPQYKTPGGESCKNGHGGAPTLDEVPTCAECNEALKPNAKFCDECGASTEPKDESDDEIKCPNCGEAVSGKFCGECGFKMGMMEPEEAEEKPDRTPVKKPEKAPAKSEKSVKIPEKKEEKAPEKTVKKPEKKEEVEEEEEAAPEEENFDFSEIDPEKEWECFGQIEPDHVECKSCAYRERCADKAGVEI